MARLAAAARARVRGARGGARRRRRSSRETPQRWSLRDALGRSPLAPLRLRRLALLATWLGGALDPDAPWRDTRLDDRSAADFCRVYLGRRALAAAGRAAVRGELRARGREHEPAALVRAARARGRARRSTALRGAGRLADALAAKLARSALRRSRSRGSHATAAASSSTTARASRATRSCSAVSAAEARAPARRAHARRGRRVRSGFARSRRSCSRSRRNAISRSPTESLWFAARDGGELAAIHRAGPRLLQLVARPGLFERHGQRPDARARPLPARVGRARAARPGRRDRRRRGSTASRGVCPASRSATTARSSACAGGDTVRCSARGRLVRRAARRGRARLGARARPRASSDSLVAASRRSRRCRPRAARPARTSRSRAPRAARRGSRRAARRCRGRG